MKNINKHEIEVQQALPKLLVNMSLLFIIVQTGLAALNLTGHYIMAHLKHS
ncbi:MAG: hypothetical protein JWP00_436 [Chloroflexi bacterium]|jgi:hypothetical protein|nr:hypothetical protein [Chloroflexota bacterium]